jgi:amidase
MAQELWRLTASEAAARIRARKLSAEEYVGACLARAFEREPEVAAFAHLDPAAAMREARLRDREKPRGPLHGVPVAWKDIVDTAAMPTAYGSRAFPGHRPLADAACVALARAAGAVLMGKTVSTEFAARYPGPTSNPHDRRRTPGGSSSGSAAAVADGMVPLAVGSQTVGSTIRPAGYCGIHALKPSYGLLSLTGVKPLCAHFDTLGLFARSLDDLALLRDALLAQPDSKPVQARKPARVAFCRTPFWSRADDATRSALEGAARSLAKQGATVRELKLPRAYGGTDALMWEIIYFDLGRSFAPEVAGRMDGLSGWMKDAIRRGRAIAPATHAANLAKCAKLGAELRRLTRGFDVVLAPAAPGEAPLTLESTGSPAFNSVWQIAGLPAVNLPAFQGPNGMPIGAGLIGRYLEDDRLLAAAAWIEPRLS